MLLLTTSLIIHPMYKMKSSKQIGRKFNHTSSVAMQTNFHVAWESILNQKQKVQTIKTKRMRLTERAE